MNNEIKYGLIVICVIFLVIFGVACEYSIATSDLDPWVKFLLLR